METTAQEYLEVAKKQLQDGENMAALRNLLQGFRVDVNFLPLYHQTATVLRDLGGLNEAALFQSVIDHPNDSTSYNDLGQFYLDNEEFILAISFFEKCLSLAPDNSTVEHDLAICYSRVFNIHKSLEILENSSANDFWHVYFLTKCRLLVNQSEGAQAVIDELQSVLSTMNSDEEGVVVAKDKVNELQEILIRLDHTPQPSKHIRDWHYIQQGGIILKFFDQAEELSVAGGRYVYLNESNEHIKEMIVRLKTYLKTLAVDLQYIVSFPDRDSEIIGQLIAQTLQIPLEYYQSQNEHHDCLIVAGNTSELEKYFELSTIKQKQITFVYHHDWLTNAVFSPDIIGLMAQFYTFPWNGGYRVMGNGDDPQLESIPVDEREVLLIVEDIMNEKNEQEVDFTEHLNFYIERKAYLKGIGDQLNSDRYNFMRESPIAGSFF